MTTDQSIAVFGDAYCPKYDLPHNRHPVIYERQNGRYAQNILELRAWKARRAIKMLQVKSASRALFSSWTHHHESKEEFTLTVL